MKHTLTLITVQLAALAPLTLLHAADAFIQAGSFQIHDLFPPCSAWSLRRKEITHREEKAYVIHHGTRSDHTGICRSEPRYTGRLDLVL